MKRVLRVASRLVLVVSIFLIMGLGQAQCAGLTGDELIELNPKFVDSELSAIFGTDLYQELTVYLDSGRDFPITFLVDNNEEILMIQKIYYPDYKFVDWHPWFDQEEENPLILKVYGTVYSQQIYLAAPEAELGKIPLEHVSSSRKVDFKLGNKVPRNFYDLKTINPGLEHYEELDPLITDDGSIILFAPPGPGMAFLTDDKGEIFTILDVFPVEGGRTSLYHPELGEFVLSNLSLREAESRFDLEEWTVERRVDRIKLDYAEWFEPGFVIEKVELEDLMGMGLMIEVDLFNDSGRDYAMVMFEMKVYDGRGKLITEGIISFMNSQDGQTTRTLPGALPLETAVDLDDLFYILKFMSAQ